MTSMGIAMALISILFFFMKDPHIVWVFIAYAFGGLGIGSCRAVVILTQL
jgi:hypothetical protein